MADQEEPTTHQMQPFHVSQDKSQDVSKVNGYLRIRIKEVSKNKTHKRYTVRRGGALVTSESIALALALAVE